LSVEAVALQEETTVHPEVVVVVVVLSAAAVAVVSSSFLQDPISATMPKINIIQNSIFFIITSFIIEKCRIVPTFKYWVWCKPKPELLPVHIILNNSKMLPGCLPRKYIPVKNRIQHLFFSSCLFRFASEKSALTTLSAI
jgi:hypothetical protein